jgi:hypothetical protein
VWPSVPPGAEAPPRPPAGSRSRRGGRDALDRKIADLNERIEAEVEAAGSTFTERDLRCRSHTGRQDLGNGVGDLSRFPRAQGPLLRLLLWQGAAFEASRAAMW